MKFDTFFEKVEAIDIRIKVDSIYSPKSNFLNNESLFQLPLISLIILLMAKDKSKPLVSEIGQLVGESLEDSIAGFKGSSQHLGWSANLRIRTVSALNFLEHTNQVEVHNAKGRIKATALGKKVIKKATDSDDMLAHQLLRISRSYRNICVSKRLEMEI